MRIWEVSDDEVIRFSEVLYKYEGILIDNMDFWIMENITIIGDDIRICRTYFYHFRIKLTEGDRGDITILYKFVCYESVTTTKDKHREIISVLEDAHRIVGHGFIIQMFFFWWELEISGKSKPEIIISLFYDDFLKIATIAGNHRSLYRNNISKISSIRGLDL
jgi:hypothetical protein